MLPTAAPTVVAYRRLGVCGANINRNRATRAESVDGCKVEYTNVERVRLRGRSGREAGIPAGSAVAALGAVSDRGIEVQ